MTTYTFSQGDGQGESSSSNNCCNCSFTLFIVIGAVLVIGVVLLVILVPFAYSDLEYFEMGFPKHKTTGVVDTSKVYMGGRHWIGIMNIFKIYPADVQTMKLQRITIYNKEKLTVTLTGTLYYKLRPEQLHLLLVTYDLNYEAVLEGNVVAALRAAAPNYAVDDYRIDRPRVIESLKIVLAEAIGGKCCAKDCKVATCVPGCKPLESCTDRGVFVELVDFFLQNVDLTSQQETLFLRKALEKERRDTEVFRQQEKITRAETAEAKARIENQALEIGKNATAQQKIIISKATAQAGAIRDAAHNLGLQTIYKALNITTEKQKHSFQYIRTLYRKQANLFIGFQYMIAKP